MVLEASLETDPPPTSFTFLSKKKEKLKKKIIRKKMKLYMWHVVHDTGQVGGGDPSLKISDP